MDESKVFHVRIMYIHRMDGIPHSLNNSELISYLENYGSIEPVPLCCPQCNKVYHRQKNHILTAFHRKTKKPQGAMYCSRECFGLSWSNLVSISCEQCGKAFQKRPSQIKQTKHSFCSQSCSATYHNQHKAFGIRRSKIELAIESDLTSTFPDLIVEYNSTCSIGAEIDIYIPALRFGVELNGILHYEPIYGTDKFERIQRNDRQKVALCRDNGIELCVLDISSVKNWSARKLDEYAKLVVDLVRTLMPRLESERSREDSNLRDVLQSSPLAPGVFDQPDRLRSDVV